MVVPDILSGELPKHRKINFREMTNILVVQSEVIQHHFWKIMINPCKPRDEPDRVITN